jgi:hypothetical protein
MWEYGAKALGPVARRLVSPARWTDAYPSCETFSKELDALLLFAEEQGCLQQFVPKLESRDGQRDDALSELRVAYWLHHNDFPIVKWEPSGLNRKIGECLIDTPESQKVFVEVKSPGWEGELSVEARLAGRTKQPKHQDGEGGSFGNWDALQKCIASPKTYPKFAPNQSNLLVVADDLKVSLHNTIRHVKIALYADHKGYGELGYFTSARFENLGGVAIFGASSYFFSNRGLEYEFQIFDNPFALASTRLPESLLKFKAKASGYVRATYIPRPA